MKFRNWPRFNNEIQLSPRNSCRSYVSGATSMRKKERKKEGSTKCASTRTAHVNDRQRFSEASFNNPWRNRTRQRSSSTFQSRFLLSPDRGTSDDSPDYSLLVACFAGGITAVCILIVGITLTLYRRSHPSMQPIKAHTEVAPQYGGAKEDRGMVVPSSKEAGGEAKGEVGNDVTDEDPDVIPSKMDKRPDIFEPGYEAVKSERTKDFDRLEELDYPSPSSVLHTKDSWIYPNGYVKKVERSLSPLRPSTLPVHRSHDIYTRSSRVQESCI